MTNASSRSTEVAHQIKVAKIFFLIAAALSFVFSITLYFYFGNKMAGIYVGLWVPSILSAGTLLLIGH